MEFFFFNNQLFYYEQNKTDPQHWTESDVAHWLTWSIKEFNLEGLDPQNFIMTGKSMCDMGKEIFLAQTPPYAGVILWEHLDRLLRGK